ncbi:MAG: hypothetical protein ABEI39_06665 [Halobacteriales archaeon]
MYVVRVGTIRMHCPTCQNPVEIKDWYAQCPECGYVPPQGAD